MILNYKFKITTDVESASLDYYDRIEPPTHEEEVEVDYEYRIDVSVEDLAEYLCLFLTEDVKKTLTKVLRVFGGLLEEDTDFAEFLTQKYEAAAREECEEDYE